MGIKAIKIISTILTIAGVAVNLATNAFGEKLLDDKIETKVAEALAKKN